mmetsp:Transcript_31575/g.65963  ORF Transcript_31575/g.65963 Transcript_31575/m.65963 type:complete len:638 (-) Transcript_31575:345-2258(-)|eukprot:CAMPEP_0172444464 /NCGR_PEP_ID=MMETSP1065-20121228/4495_1 /TAXON_ID=265537 /ORGANISM="Amphiprora paludosa, Strain CCMP125" /LENGTH=637 /DNA_ID=CAMNT_0013195007 /DNA_START=147 /DNA_END=2060 /DNA_ORIENTATION=-
MGDCRLIIHIDRHLCPEENGNVATENSDQSDSNYFTLRPTFSADTTWREVLDQVQLPSTSLSLRSLMRGPEQAQLWNATTHPVSNITHDALHVYSAIKGSASKTLYDSDWYPSGTWYLLPKNGALPPRAGVRQHFDVQYNLQAQPSSVRDENATATAAVTRAAPPKMTHLKPSQLLAAAQSPTVDPQEALQQEQAAAAARRTRRRQQETQEQVKQENRQRRLQACLTKLDNNKKSSSSSGQVRRLLWKSRATGRSNLTMPDRVYMECLVTIVTENGKASPVVTLDPAYRFFSRQDTIAQVLASFQSEHQATLQKLAFKDNSRQRKDEPAWRLEFCIADPEPPSENDTPSLQQLPHATRLHHALERCYLKAAPGSSTAGVVQEDPINIRICQYSITPTPFVVSSSESSVPSDPPSSSINETTTTTHPMPVDPPTERDPPTAMDVDDGELNQQDSGDIDISYSIDPVGSLDPSGSKADDDMEDDHAPAALVQAVQESLPKAKKKTKAWTAAQKVRHMQLKSKAVGDAKRVPLPHRFFLQVILVVTNGSNNTVQTTTSHFLHIRKDGIARLMRDSYDHNRNTHVPASVAAWDYWVWHRSTPEAEEAHNWIRLSATQMSMEELQKQGVLQPFDTLILVGHS